MTYGLYIGISALPIATGSKEELRAQVSFLDPADRAHGWTIVPIAKREPWPRHVEGRKPLSPLWLAFGCAFALFTLFAACNILSR